MNPDQTSGVFPECHSRGAAPAGGRHVLCRHPEVYTPGRRVTPEICRVCSHRLLPPPERLLEMTETASPPTAAGCVHLGPQVGERACPTCRGSVRVKIYSCRHERHTETTLRACRACPDRSA